MPNATKKKKNRASEMEHLRLWIDIRGKREGKKERKKEINSTWLVSIDPRRGGQKGSRVVSSRLSLRENR